MLKNFKHRTSRIAFCEWNHASMGHYNTGGIICKACKFSRVLNRGEDKGFVEKDNKIQTLRKCPNCGSTKDWYFFPPIARLPRKNARNKVWSIFWKNLINRNFNHPKWCR